MVTMNLRTGSARPATEYSAKRTRISRARERVRKVKALTVLGVVQSETRTEPEPGPDDTTDRAVMIRMVRAQGRDVAIRGLARVLVLETGMSTEVAADQYLAEQRKYDLDARSPAWKKAFFRFVYLPFVRFSFFNLGIVPIDGREKDGRLSWLEQQGIYTNRWRAEQEAGKYAFGLVQRLPCDDSLPPESVYVEQHHPNSPAKQKYEKENEANTVSFPRDQVHRLIKKAQERDRIAPRSKVKSA